MNGISILSRPLAGVATDATTDAMHQPWTGHDTQVLVVAAIGIAIVVLLIVWAKMHAFLALSIGALFVGIASGIALDKVTTSYENGVGGVLGYVGVLIALGAMLGKLLADSGGADKIVDTLLHGRPATLPWKMALIAGIIGIPMFFEIGLVLLIPVVMLAVHRSKGPAMRLGIPASGRLVGAPRFHPAAPGPVGRDRHPARQCRCDPRVWTAHSHSDRHHRRSPLWPSRRTDRADRSRRRWPRRHRWSRRERRDGQIARPRRKSRQFARRRARRQGTGSASNAQPVLWLDPGDPAVAVGAHADQSRGRHLDGQERRRSGPCWTSSAIRSLRCSWRCFWQW